MDDELLFRCVTGRATDLELAAVRKWRGASTQNEDRYQEMARLLALAARADAGRVSGRAPSAEQIVDLAESWRARVAAATRPPEETRPAGRGFWWGYAAAAVVLALVGAGAWRVRVHQAAIPQGIAEVATERGEVVTVALGDGSVIRLGPQSRLRMVPGHAKEIALEGHAYFAVAKQNGRPLRIKTPSGDVTVVGTRFDLEATATQLRLMVVEGRVVISSGGPETAVAAGEQARIIGGTKLPVVAIRPEDLQLHWLGDFLAFQNTPLRDAAREIERQFRVRVALTDSSLASQTVTGWFAGWPLEQVVGVVCTVTNAQCTTANGVVTMRPRDARVR